MKKYGVIGSLNIDIVVTSPHFHQPGETIIGESVDYVPGGKGGNQAVALARLCQNASQVYMFGKLGQDEFSRLYQDVFIQEKINSNAVESVQGTCGTALIEVDKSSGDNRIVVVPGVNNLVDRSYIDRHFNQIKECDIILFQLEIPLDTVLYAVEKLKPLGKTLILDPAPAQSLPDSLYRCVDFITPNETEAEILTSVKFSQDLKEIEQAGIFFQKMGTKTSIIKAGSKGAFLVEEGKSIVAIDRISNIVAVDTTAAGDSFNAGFAYAIGDLELSLEKAITFAHGVAGLATTKKGAQTAMPNRVMVDNLLKEANRFYQ